MFCRGNERSLSKWLLILSNLLIFLVALGVINLRMKTVAPPENSSSVSEGSLVPVEQMFNEVRAQMQVLAAKTASKSASSYRTKDVWECIRPWRPLIERYSREFGVDPDLVSAILYTESRGDPNTISPRGALGLMQITPATARHLGIEDILDPEENIRAGVKYISGLIRKYDEPSALLAYNAGPSIFERNRVPRETRQFLERVLSLKSFLKSTKKRHDLS